MNDALTRREFLRVSASVAAGAGLALTVGGALADQSPPASQPDNPDKIPLRVLGRTGVKVSILGLGGDGLVSDSTNDEAVVKFLNSVLDSGINYFDTAHMYGKDGRCETNLGLVTGGPRRKDIFLATKTGARHYDTAMQQIETSLKRLRTDRLDLIQVHHLTDEDDLKELGTKAGVLSAMRKLQDQKVVRFIGLTGHPDEVNIKKALEMYDWDTLMCFVNPAKFSRPALEEQLPTARKKGIGV
ncbi:MAG: aldo/keto reductase, partial [Phycisphaerae bacterium]|nr:aldo/keto reductase [Phycisphaerae bacterium]